MPPADPGEAAGLHAPPVDLTAVLAVLREVAAARIAVPEAVAAEITGLSPKTLQRAALAGEPTGRRKVGVKVVYLTDELREWLRARPTT